MDSFDRRLRRMARREGRKAPEGFSESVGKTLAALPEMEERRVPSGSPWLAAAKAFAVLMVILLVLPNLSPSIARAMESIPVLGDFFRVVTIRNYVYDDGYHDLDAKVPSVETDGTGSDAVSKINEDVQTLTDRIIAQFYEDVEVIGDQGHTGLSIDYDVVTNSDEWFTLRLMVYQASGSGSVFYKFYHIDRQTGEIRMLADLFEDADAALDAITQEIKRQMEARMAADENVVYWIDSDYPEWDFVSLDGEHNFYFSENGELVIAFDEYEVAPGSMGCPEFAIAPDVYSHYLREEFASLAQAE
ncbi:MAG: RsiV family protein [Oscillospiraceae bacterium]